MRLYELPFSLPLFIRRTVTRMRLSEIIDIVESLQRSQNLRSDRGITTFHEQTVSASPSMSRIVERYWLELILGILLIVFSLNWAISRSYYFNGGFTYPSLIAYGACFLLTCYFLNRQGVGIFDRVMYSLAAMASGIVLLEIVYHYGYGITSTLVLQNMSSLGLDSGNGAFPLVWFVIIFLIPFIGRRYMKLNWPLLGLVASGAVVMFGWISIGYPQFPWPQWWPAYNVYFTNVIATVNGKGVTSSVVFYGELFRRMTKSISVIPAFFFNKK